MKNVFKKIVATALAVSVMTACAFSLASCSKSDLGFKDNTIKIGATGPLTGDAALYGTSVMNGALLAVEHLNQKGGIQFSFDIKDDQATSAAAATNYDTLYEDGMQVSLGGVTSGSGEAFATKAVLDKVFCMTPSGSADPVINTGKYSFRLCFGDPDQGKLAVEKIIEAGYTNVGALYDSSDSYSSGIFDAFEKAMAAAEKTFVKKSFTSETTDFSSYAEELKDCDVIFMPFYYQKASLVAQALTQKGSDAVLFGCDGFDGIADYLNGVTNKVMYITPFNANSDDAKVKEFVEAYEARFGKTPDQFAADAYDVVMAIAAAIEKAGITDANISAAELGEKLVEVFTSEDFTFDGLTGSGMTWDARGACTKDPQMVELNYQ